MNTSHEIPSLVYTWRYKQELKLIVASYNCEANFGWCAIINPTSIVFSETSGYWSVQFTMFGNLRGSKRTGTDRDVASYRIGPN